MPIAGEEVIVDIDTLKMLVRLGKSTGEIARRMEIHPNHVRAAISSLGIPFPRISWVQDEDLLSFLDLVCRDHRTTWGFGSIKTLLAWSSVKLFRVTNIFNSLSGPDK